MNIFPKHLILSLALFLTSAGLGLAQTDFLGGSVTQAASWSNGLPTSSDSGTISVDGSVNTSTHSYPGASVTQSAGTIDADAFNFTGGTWNLTGGRIEARFVLANQPISTINASGGTIFLKDVTGNQRIGVANGGNLTISGTAILDASQATLAVSTNGSIDILSNWTGSWTQGNYNGNDWKDHFTSGQITRNSTPLNGAEFDAFFSVSDDGNTLSANFLVNGSFEEPAVGNINSNNGGAVPTGWSSTGPDIAFNLIRNDGTPYGGGVNNAADGSQILDLNGEFEIFQIFTLSQNSTLSFGASFANRETHDGSAPSTVGIYTADGATLLSPLVSVDLSNDSTPSDSWSSGQSEVRDLPPGDYQVRVDLNDFNNVDDVFVIAVPLMKVNQNLGTLGFGTTNISGNTADGGNNVDNYPLFNIGSSDTWENEFVFKFILEQASTVSLRSNTLTGDPDAFLLNGLGTRRNGSRIEASRVLARALLDGAVGSTETFGTVPAGTYYLSVDSFGNVTPRDATFDYDLIIAAAEAVPSAPDTESNLGRFSPDRRFSIHTNGSEFNTELALWDSTGRLILQNDDVGNLLHSELYLENGLAVGRYYFAIGGHDSIFSNGFGAIGGGEGGAYALSFPGFGRSSGLESEEIHFFSFTIDYFINGGGLDSEFRIIQVQLNSPTQAFVQWTSVPGARYAIECSTDLTDWTELDCGITSQGDTAFYFDTNLDPTASRKYYRVREMR